MTVAAIVFEAGRQPEVVRSYSRFAAAVADVAWEAGEEAEL